MQLPLKPIILCALSMLILTACTEETGNVLAPSFLKTEKTYIVGIPKHTPRNENTPITTFSMTVLEHGGGSWYRIAFKSYDSNPAKTIETWFNLDSATFVSEGEHKPAKDIFPLM